MTDDYPGLRSKHNEAAAIVAQLSLDEKAQLCSGRNFWYLEGIERMDLPPVMVTDGPHGLRKQDRSPDHVGLNKSVPATCFPTACALAATWDVDLITQVGKTLGRECLNQNVTVLLGPGVNIKRSPLCGRNFEYFSEDPYLTGKIAGAFIRGVQSQGVGTSIKHFAVNNQENGRMILDAIVDQRTLREIYLRGFEIAIRESQPWTVMCAYNRLNGPYCSEHNWLLNEVLREEWNFQGLVVTDWGATNDRVQGVISGLDLEMPGSGGVNDTLVHQAALDGTLPVDQLDRSIQRNISLSLLGAEVQNTEMPVDYDEHHILARRVAMEASVLLKNENHILPLAMNTPLAVIGEFAQKPRYQGTGSSQVNPTQLDRAWDTLSEYTDAILYAPGYDARNSIPDDSLIADAVDAAKQAEVALVFAGLPGIYESEGFDRTHLDMPEQHNRLIEAVCEANPNTIVVLCNGAPVSMPWVSQPKAILEAYLPGQAGGSAVADLLFGIAAPSGKLAETFPLALSDVPSNQWMEVQDRQVQYREGLNVGYRYFDTANVPVLFPFGHGLSYCPFGYTNLQLSESTVSRDIRVDVTVTVQNLGDMPAAEVVQCYISDVDATIFRPEQELKAFTKVFLAPGGSTDVTFSLKSDAFQFYDPGFKRWLVEDGEYEIRIGASSRDIRLQERIKIKSGDVASPQVRSAYPPATPDCPLNVDDLTFRNQMGGTVPRPEAVRPFHLNTSVGELDATWLGRRFAAKVIDQFTQSMNPGSRDATLTKMFEEMAKNMPLRGLVLFSQGGMSYQQLHTSLALMNHQYLRAFLLWLKS